MNEESAQAIEVPDVDATDDDDDGGAGSWLVQTRSGVRSWSLDELDAAFQRGEVDAGTLVLERGMSAWTPLGVIASLDEPIANDTRAPLEPSSTRAASAPASANVFGTGGASLWTGIGTERADLQTGLRHRTPVVPFALRRAFGGALDAFSNLRATHPRWAAAGPWSFGAALSGIFMVSLYWLANAPSLPPEPAPGAQPAQSTSVELARSVAADAPPVPASRAPAPRAGDAANDSAANDSPPNDGAAGDDGAVLRLPELRPAPNRSERQRARSGRAKAKAAAARKARIRAARQRGRRGD